MILYMGSPKHASRSDLSARNIRLCEKRLISIVSLFTIVRNHNSLWNLKFIWTFVMLLGQPITRVEDHFRTLLFAFLPILWWLTLENWSGIFDATNCIDIYDSSFPYGLTLSTWQSTLSHTDSTAPVGNHPRRYP